MTNNMITMTKSAFDHHLKMAHDDGYQEGLFDGLTDAARNSQPANITHDTSLSQFVQSKRIVATGNENGLTAVDYAAFDDDDRAVLEILTGPMKGEPAE
jgi:hypothetical protein